MVDDEDPPLDVDVDEPPLDVEVDEPPLEFSISISILPSKPPVDVVVVVVVVLPPGWPFDELDVLDEELPLPSWP